MRILVVFALVLLPLNAQANGPYVSGKVGVGVLASHQFHETEFSYYDGLALSGALGWDFGYLRFEVEALDVENNAVEPVKSITNGLGPSQDRKFYFVNGYLDLPVTEFIEVFIGSGYSQKEPAFQFIGGLSYKLDPNWGLGLSYKYVKEPWNTRPRGPEAIYMNNIVLFSVTYNFWE